MKISHIIGLVVIAVSISIIVSTASDASVYVTFSQAAEVNQKGDDDLVHVVGDLRKDATGRVLDTWYNPTLDPNHFEFMLTDDDRQARKVIYKAPEPQDFGRAERIVVVGTMGSEYFLCEKILLTCPSKYQDNRLETTEHIAKRNQSMRVQRPISRRFVVGNVGQP